MIRVSFITIAVIALLPIVFRYTAVPFLHNSEGRISKQVSHLSEQYSEGAGRLVSSSLDAVGDGLDAAYDFSKAAAIKAISINGVVVSGNSIIREDQLFDSEPKIAGKRLWQISPDDVEQQALKNPWIKEATAERQGFPVSIVLKVVEKKPIAVAELEGSSWLVADSGELIQELKEVTDVDLIERSLEFPRLSGFDRLKSDPNFSFNVAFRYVANFLNDIEQAGGMPFNVERFELQDGGTIVAIPQDRNSPKVIFAAVDKEDSVKELLARAQLVLKDLQMKGETAGELDMRFKNQAIIR